MMSKTFVSVLDERIGFNTSILVDYLDGHVPCDTAVVTEEIIIPPRIPLNLPVIEPTVAAVVDDNLNVGVEGTNKDLVSEAHADIIANQPIVLLTRLGTEDDPSKPDPLINSIAGNFNI